MSNNRWSSANIRFQLTRTTLMPLLDQLASPVQNAPIVIGGMGGSGTRIPVMILEQVGYWFGSWVNQKTKDAMAPRWLLENAFNRLLEAEERQDQDLEEDFLRLIRLHQWGMSDPDGRWGWKNPRTMWIIPFLYRLYPNMKFIHVIRDGRDMALTANKNLLRKHGAYLLDDPDCEKDTVHAQFKLWALGNKMAWDAGKKYLGKNYLLLDYDQLCNSSESEIRRLLNFLGLEEDGPLVDRCLQMIHHPRGFARWRQSNKPLVRTPDQKLREALTFFGYE